MPMASVAILGCGPSGLLAAHAAVIMGLDPHVYSIRSKSVTPGAMYIHEPITDITPIKPDGEVNFIKTGTAHGYALKVYGRRDAPTSWEQFPQGKYQAWSMGAAYDRLWATYEGAIRHRELNSDAVADLRRSYGTVISTIPAPALCLCPAEHSFASQKVYISDSPYRELDEGDILYNGDETDHWYRSSLIFGHGATESTQRMPGSFEGRKPLSTDCDCWPEVDRVGRFGSWRKGVLVHHAFRQALEIFNWEGAGS